MMSLMFSGTFFEREMFSGIHPEMLDLKKRDATYLVICRWKNTYLSHIWGFPSMGVPKNGWFIGGNPCLNG